MQYIYHSAARVWQMPYYGGGQMPYYDAGSAAAHQQQPQPLPEPQPQPQPERKEKQPERKEEEVVVNDRVVREVPIAAEEAYAAINHAYLELETGQPSGEGQPWRPVEESGSPKPKGINRLHRILMHVAVTEFPAAQAKLEEVHADPCGDEAVERKAYEALETLEKVTGRYFTNTAMKEARRSVQDVLVLACARGIEDSLLNEKKIPEPMTKRLAKAARRDVAALVADRDLWARLGKTKYHVFTQGRKWGKRKPKLAKRPPQPKRESSATAAAAQHQHGTSSAASSSGSGFVDFVPSLPMNLSTHFEEW